MHRGVEVALAVALALEAGCAGDEQEYVAGEVQLGPGVDPSGFAELRIRVVPRPTSVDDSPPSGVEQAPGLSHF